MSSPYWVVAVPNRKDPDHTRASLKDVTEAKGLSHNFAFKIPSMKVGTLDQLMTLSDELSKHDTMVGQVAKRIEKAFQEIWKTEPQEGDSKDSKERTTKAPELKVGDKSPSDYLEDFKWNNVRYPSTRATLRALIDTIVKDATKADNEMRKQVGEYNEVRNTVAAMDKKEQGSLLVKSLGQFVRKQHMVETPHLTTLMVVVAKKSLDEFMNVYSKLDTEMYAREDAAESKQTAEDAQIKQLVADMKSTHVADAQENTEEDDGDSERKKLELEMKQDAERRAKEEAEAKEAQRKAEAERKAKERKCPNIVPNSAIVLSEDADYALVRVVVMKKGADTFKAACRERKYTVREFKYDPEGDKTIAAQRETLDKHRKKLWTYLVMWCKTNFTEIFAAWVHLKAMRVFVESVLRFGLPVNFCATLLLPTKNSERKLRTALQNQYGYLASANLTQALDANEVDLSGLGADFYPYVYLSINLQD